MRHSAFVISSLMLLVEGVFLVVPAVRAVTPAWHPLDGGTDAPRRRPVPRHLSRRRSRCHGPWRPGHPERCAAGERSGGRTQCRRVYGDQRRWRSHLQRGLRAVGRDDCDAVFQQAATGESVRHYWWHGPLAGRSGVRGVGRKRYGPDRDDLLPPDRLVPASPLPTDRGTHD